MIQHGFAGAAVTSSEQAAAGASAAPNATVAETRACRSPQGTLFRRAHVRRLRDDSEILKLRVSMVMDGLLLHYILWCSEGIAVRLTVDWRLAQVSSAVVLLACPAGSHGVRRSSMRVLSCQKVIW